MNTVSKNKPKWKQLLKDWILPLMAGVVPAALVVLAAEKLLRSLGGLIEAVGARVDGSVSADIIMFGEIFGQIRMAKMDMPWIAVGIVCCLLALMTAKLIRRRWIKVLLWVFVLLAAFAGTLWFTDVNDIRFGAAIMNLPVLMKSGML